MAEPGTEECAGDAGQAKGGAGLEPDASLAPVAKEAEKRVQPHDGE